MQRACPLHNKMTDPKYSFDVAVRTFRARTHTQTQEIPQLRSELYSPFIFVIIGPTSFSTFPCVNGCVSHCYRKTALYRTTEAMMGVQLYICILIRNVIFSIVFFFTNKQQDVLFVFLIVFVCP